MKAVAVCTRRKVGPLAGNEANMEPAHNGFHKIVAEILRRAPAEDVAGIAWEITCGRTVAEKTAVLEFREGTLRVRVPDEAWRASLAGFMPRYIELLNTMLSRRVEEIEFVLPQKASQRKGAA